MHGCEVTKCMKFKGVSAKLAVSVKIVKSQIWEKMAMGRNCTWVHSAKGEGAAHPGASARSVVRDTGKPACGWVMKRRPVEADPGLGCCGGPRGAGPNI